MSETEIQQAIRQELGLEPGLVLWRNTVGMTQEWDAKTGARRTITYGLCPGSADLVGLLEGRFVALEVKTLTGKPSDDQTRWMNLVRTFGGFACIVRSAAEARAAIMRARAGASQ